MNIAVLIPEAAIPEFWAGSTYILSLKYPKPLKGHLISSCFSPSISNWFHRKHNFSFLKGACCSEYSKSQLQTPSQLKKKVWKEGEPNDFFKSFYFRCSKRVQPPQYQLLWFFTSVNEELLSLTLLPDCLISAMRPVSHKPILWNVLLSMGPVNPG